MKILDICTKDLDKPLGEANYACLIPNHGNQNLYTNGKPFVEAFN